MQDQRRIRIFGFEPDRGGEALVGHVLHDLSGVTATQFDGRRQSVCIEFLKGSVTLDALVAAIENHRLSSDRKPRAMSLLLSRTEEES